MRIRRKRRAKREEKRSILIWMMARTRIMRIR
jgi:hypothetical protein